MSRFNDDEARAILEEARSRVSRDHADSKPAETSGPEPLASDFHERLAQIFFYAADDASRELVR